MIETTTHRRELAVACSGPGGDDDTVPGESGSDPNRPFRMVSIFMVSIFVGAIRMAPIRTAPIRKASGRTASLHQASIFESPVE